MALNVPLTPLVITLTQGSADAFVQGSVLTALSGRQAYNLKNAFFELTNPAAISALANDFEISFALTRRSKTAMPNMSDTDVMWKQSIIYGVTTSGAWVLDGIRTWSPQLDVPIVEETIYACLDSTATTLSNTAVVRLEVELDSISDIDRLNLITRSLT